MEKSKKDYKKEIKQKLQKQYFRFEKQYYELQKKYDKQFSMLFDYNIDMIEYYRLSRETEILYAKMNYYYKCKEYIYRKICLLED